MLMRIEMFLTIFIIPVTLGTETEGQIRAVNLRASADGTFMLCDGNHFVYLSLISILSLNLLRRPESPSGHDKENMTFNKADTMAIA